MGKTLALLKGLIDSRKKFAIAQGGIQAVLYFTDSFTKTPRSRINMVRIVGIKILRLGHLVNGDQGGVIFNALSSLGVTQRSIDICVVEQIITEII